MAETVTEPLSREAVLRAEQRKRRLLFTAGGLVIGAVLVWWILGQMSLKSFWLQMLNGLSFGAVLFFLASGFTLIFGLMRITNLQNAISRMTPVTDFTLTTEILLAHNLIDGVTDGQVF